MTESRDSLYPELADAGSLGAVLNGVSPSAAGPGYEDLGGPDGPARARAVEGDRSVVVGLAVRERRFLLTFSGAGQAAARAETPDLVGAARSAQDWLDGVPPRELGARWPFVVVDELRLAYQEGNEVEVAWRLVRREVQEDWRGVVEAAYARSELASMFPVFSHGVFRMLRSSRFTRYDTPFVRRAGRGFVLQHEGGALAEGGAEQMIEGFLDWLAHH
ncbi:DUF6193 family natural product biosynthesis protein [Streptomyces sp. NBC_00096]|uniref:DUF6193 family natural product biosynthesis protein n=1 Tax=Streptomyces sp. NBC_00096 TaxID=2975650 RepID=UPI003249C01E